MSAKCVQLVEDDKPKVFIIGEGRGGGGGDLPTLCLHKKDFLIYQDLPHQWFLNEFILKYPHPHTYVFLFKIADYGEICKQHNTIINKSLLRGNEKIVTKRLLRYRAISILAVDSISIHLKGKSVNFVICTVKHSFFISF